MWLYKFWEACEEKAILFLKNEKRKKFAYYMMCPYDICLEFHGFDMDFVFQYMILHLCEALHAMTDAFLFYAILLSSWWFWLLWTFSQRFIWSEPLYTVCGSLSSYVE